MHHNITFPQSGNAVRSTAGLIILAGLMALGLVGCSDPAKDTPDAVVQDAKGGGEGASEAPAGGKTYTLTDESVLQFVGSKVTGSHEGGFNSVTGSVIVKDGAIHGNGPIVIDMNSIWSDNQKLTGHLKNKDFFEVETYPTSKFTITSVAKEGELYNVTGDLEMHGVTKSITFPANITVSDDSLAVDANFDINRQLWNINYTGMADDLIRDNVVLKMSIKAKP